MLAPFSVAEISPAWKARLLFVSSQARPPSSHESFQNDCMNLTESTAPSVLITTFLPVFFNTGKTLAAASHVLGYSLAPASFSQDFRYATALPTIEWGSASHLPLTSQEGGKIS